MEELLEASRLLRSCLDRYIGACSAITLSYNPADKDINSPVLNAITNELRIVADYERDARNAKSILARSRNSSQAVVPMSALPAEVLERIFQLADDIQYNMNVKLPSPMFPEALSHVCARWRQVALSSHRLWSRIDVPIFSQSYKWLLLRGKTFASRATELDLHIFMTNDEMEGGSLYSRLDRFCAGVGSKLRALQLTNGVKARDGLGASMLTPLLNASFKYIEPGALDHIALIDHYPAQPEFIRSSDTLSSCWYRPISIDIPQRQIDDVLGPIRSLWMENHFFPWKSPAYHGLVDLRLLTSGEARPISIESAQLRNILSACPKLRTFHCGIEVVDTKTVAQDISEPVYLAELEYIHLRRMSPDQHQYLLPLILPGPKPISLSIQVAKPSPTEELFSTTVLDFFTRSNVVALYIKGHCYTASLSLERLLKDSPPSTRIIGLQSFNIDQENARPFSFKQSYLTQLECLNLTLCTFDINVLRGMADVCPIREIKIFTPECFVYTVYSSKERVTSETLDELVAIFPIVKSIEKLSPIEEWNSWETVEWEWGTE
ncbi:F-box-like domain protein [Rhizoctonia solani 123E]|uniref:F-box-like domain protein n=1 Tax=Rhizoctonia solani 123E TaxID=1423351 RepID=A0A074RKC3_9AGAM|nr:F-box-like domain protein [Rhizoctonia solani 123E]